MELLEKGSQKLLVDLENGAAIKELLLEAQKGVRTIIKDQKYGHASAFLFPFPNRLADGHFNFKDQSYQFPMNDSQHQHAIHGFLYDQTFLLTSKTPNSLGLYHSYKGHLPYYPFPFDIHLNYALQESSLSMRLAIHNTGNTEMPCALGWHPYFYVGKIENVQLQLPHVMIEELNARAIVSGKIGPFETFGQPVKIGDRHFDHCFCCASESEIQQSSLTYDNGEKLTIWQNSDMKWIQIFTPDDRSAIAIEPMTAPSNVFNHGRGLKVLAPRGEWELAFGLKLE